MTLIDAAGYSAIEDRLGDVLATGHDALVLPGEAILALEALARGLGGPETRSLNVVSGPYGAMMGRWLGAAGGPVATVQAPEGHAIAAEVVRDALAGGPFDVVCVVHAEAATGVVNPLVEIAAAVHETDAMLVVDAVASVGAEPLDIDALGLDAVVIGPQKALSGPAGVAGLLVDPAVWALMERNPAAPRDSILSLLDVRDRWLAAGRRVLPFVPHHLETAALGDALGVLGAIGMDATVARHHHARDAARAGLRALGLSLWVADDAEAAAVATLARPPAGISAVGVVDTIRIAAPVAPAPGPLADAALRIMHAGPDATLEAVLRSLAAIADALETLGAAVGASAGHGALDAARDAWAAT